MLAHSAHSVLRTLQQQTLTEPTFKLMMSHRDAPMHGPGPGFTFLELCHRIKSFPCVQKCRLCRKLQSGPLSNVLMTLVSNRTNPAATVLKILRSDPSV